MRTGVDKALEADLQNAGVFVKGISLAGGALDGRPYYEEVRSSLMRERKRNWVSFPMIARF